MSGTDDGRSEAGPAPGSAWRLFLRGLRFVRPQRTRALVGLLLALVAAGIGAVEPLLLKFIFDGLTAGSPVAVLVTGVVGLVALHLFKEGFAMLGNWINWRVRIAVKYRMMGDIVDHLHQMPLEFHQEESVGGLMTRLQRGTESFVAAIDQFVFQTVPAVAYLGFAAFFMFTLDARMAVLVLLLTPLPALVGVWAAKEQTQRERNLMDRWVRIYARFHEVLGGIRVVKSFSAEDREKRRFLDEVDNANQVVVRGVARDSFLNGVMTLLGVFARVAAIALGGWLVLQGEITLGTMIAFIGYVQGFFGPVQGLTGIYQSTRRGLVGLEVVLGILDHQDRLGDRPDAVEAPHFAGRVTFRDVHFGYQPDAPVLRGLDLEVHEGEMLAVVGPSGSGKTTMTALLQRLYEPWRGQVMIDGTEVSRYRQRSLRNQIGTVFQDTLLFDDPVREVIAYGRPEASMTEVEAAAKAAHAHEFIMALPDGYGTRAGEGGKRFSTGQRQRIAIARCLLKDPSIVVLDEATSALDAESEAKVQAALDDLIRGRTTFIIAHRLATVVEADRIVVLRDGKVMEQGTHYELLRADGYYASLVRHQTSGLILDEPPGEASPVGAT